jgi:hypothetical protein
METINHEYYVSLEVSKLLKEAGFDWAGYDFYNLDDNNKFHFVGVGPTNWNDIDGRLSAPTLAVAQRWLRQEKEMYAEAYLSESHHAAVWIAEVYLWENRPLGRELRDKCLCTGIGPVYFDTYEEAQEAGIKKALELILEEANQ